jgi:general secretion pathway protein J
MMLMLFAGLRISANSWDKAETKLIQVNEINTVHHFFHNQLAASLPLWDNFTEKIQQFSFQGTTHTLQFVSSLPASSNRLGLQYFHVYLEDKQIKVLIKPFYPTLANQEWAIETVTLVDKITALTFSYFGAKKLEEDADWQTEWTDDKLPQLVAIDIKTTQANHWPKIVLKLHNKTRQPLQHNIFDAALEKSNNLTKKPL